MKRKDLTSITHEKCECGRTIARISRFTGRSDDMLIIRGVNVFPSQVETVIARFEDKLTMNYKLYVGREDNKDTFELAVELADGIDVDNMKFLAELKTDVDHELRSILGIGCKIRLLSPGALPRSEGKAKRVEDTRNL